MRHVTSNLNVTTGIVTADVKIEFVVIRSVPSKNVDATGDLGWGMA